MFKFMCLLKNKAKNTALALAGVAKLVGASPKRS